MKVLIVEPRSGGHYLRYVRLLVDEVNVQAGYTFLLTSQTALDSQEFKVHLASHCDRMTIEVSEREQTPAEVAILAARLDVDLVVVPSADRFVLRVALGGWPSTTLLSCLVMQDPSWVLRVRHPPRSLPRMMVKELLLRMAARRSRVRVHRLAPSAFQPSPGRIADPVSLDLPAKSSSLSVDLRALPERYWFGLVGVVSPHKNPALAVRAFRGLRNHSCGLLIAGPVREPVRRELAREVDSARGEGLTVRMIDRVLSDEEVNEAVAFINCLLLLYNTDAPNSTAAKAALLGTNIVAAGSRAFLHHAASLGAFCSSLDLQPIVANLERACTSEAPRMGDRPDPRQFARRLLGTDDD